MSASDADVRQRLVIARVGWCAKYDGSPDDLPRKGGEWNVDNVGGEHRNFVQYSGKHYGWVKPPGPRISLRRVGGKAADDLQSLDDVCVAWIATRDGFGQVLVGWYRHAKLYAEYRRHGARGFYEFVCAEDDAVLLTPDERRLRIPKGEGATGQKNVRYARDASGSLLKGAFFDEVRRAILRDGSGRSGSKSGSLESADAIVRGQGFQFDVRYRKIIERHAMACVRKVLRAQYDVVDDRSADASFDFVCRKKNGKERLIEVKGTTTKGDVVLFSRAERELAKNEPVDLYVVYDIAIEEDSKSVSASGGKIAVYKNWGRKGFPATPLGFAVTLQT